MTYAYDEGDFSDSGLSQNISPVQHHNTNFGSGFAYRGNLTSTTRWDVTDASNSSAAVTSSMKYNTAGAVVSRTTPWDGTNTRTIKIGYADNYNSTPGVTTYAYPTSIADPADHSSTVKYRYDIGANVEANSPAPSGQTYGKTTRVSSSVSETRYTGFDELERLLTHQQITNGQTYSTGYEYNLSGGLIKETYPSGREVHHEIDADGDLSRVWGQRGSAITTYANAFNYNAAGAVEKLRLGNGRWETSQYNSRLQVTKIGLGTGSNDAGLVKLEYDYGNSTLNNGSLREQKITVPSAGGSSGITAVQTYTYDDLNSLQQAKEMVGATEKWKQTFTIDRYGNREFDAVNTTTLGSLRTGTLQS